MTKVDLATLKPGEKVRFDQYTGSVVEAKPHKVKIQWKIVIDTIFTPKNCASLHRIIPVDNK